MASCLHTIYYRTFQCKICNKTFLCYYWKSYSTDENRWICTGGKNDNTIPNPIVIVQRTYSNFNHMQNMSNACLYCNFIIWKTNTDKHKMLHSCNFLYISNLCNKYSWLIILRITFFFGIKNGKEIIVCLPYVWSHFSN